MKRTIRTSVCLFLAAILLAAMGVSGLAEQETVSEGTEEMLSTSEHARIIPGAQYGDR